MKHLLLTVLLLGVLICTCRAEPERPIMLAYTSHGSVVATVGEREFAAIEDLEQHLAKSPAGSGFRVVILYKAWFAQPTASSPIGVYAKAVDQFCSDHHLVSHIRYHGF